MERTLRNQTALVTGGGRGIGRAVALALGRAGAAVVVASRTPGQVEETVDLLAAEGIPALGVAADVGDWDSVRRMVHRAVDRFGDIHVLVNNAGIQGAIGPLVENDPDAWMRTLQVNLGGAFYCCKAVLPAMIARCYGKIINLSGGGATAPRPNFSAYAAAKAGLVRLTETLAEEVKEYNIQVNAIAPGVVNTHMLQETLAAGELAGPKEYGNARQQVETGGTPPELAAELVVFLASGASGDLSGRLIAAPYDGWKGWGAEQIRAWTALPWFTLRRMDPYTLAPFMENLVERGLKA